MEDEKERRSFPLLPTESWFIVGAEEVDVLDLFVRGQDLCPPHTSGLAVKLEKERERERSVEISTCAC